MQLLFIDESGTIPPKSKIKNINQFVLGEIVIPSGIWHEVDKELAVLKQQFKITGEIKWRYFSPGSKSSPISHLNANEKERLREELYKLITKFKAIRLICSIVDVKEAYEIESIQGENGLYWYAYKQITKRFQYYLQNLSRTVGTKINGIIVCDHRQPKDDYQLRVLHQRLLTGSKKHFSIYENLVEGVFLAPSHLSVGIQLADMVAGAVYRKFSSEDSRFYDLLATSFRKSASGKVEGYGLVKWPKKK